MSVSPENPAGDVVVLVGNPAAGSRTGAVARAVATGLVADRPAAPVVIELADLGSALCSPEDGRVARARDVVRQARVLVVATPVYKAGYTGVLKLFLDGLEPTALASTVTVPVVLTASSAHGVMADLQLRLVLQAVGAHLPVPSFVLEEHRLDRLPDSVDAWQQRHGRAVSAVASAVRLEEVGVR
jgi:FMN reductase